MPIDDLQIRLIEGARSEIIEGLNVRSVDVAILAGPLDAQLGDAMFLG